ncbi:MAG: M48 family metalloprotease [Candidatus Rokuibacteriota bacterium]|jgi:predicted Zn-dependent protease|nr:M48 family metalloprotease [Patescibacteria group bacterium]
MTTLVTRRQYTYGLVATMATLAGGCATMSPSEERRLGQEAAEEVEQTVGLVRDPKLVGYVRQVGGRLAQAAQRPDITWRFNVADDPETNAFALPGGWVYATRGLLALLNSEDELAGVLGHEMAHVLERHAARRVSAATPFAVIFGVPAAILGSVSPTLGGMVSGTGRAASTVALASYSRDQEREADQRGLVLIARAGYDPTALAAFLRTLEREEALSGQNPDRARFLSSHPATPERVASVEAAARLQARAPGTPIAGSRTAFVGRLEGLVIGDDPATGLFLGSLFVQPDLDLALTMPAGWKTINSPEVAAAVAPDGNAAVLLNQVGPGEDPVAGAKADGVPDAQMKRLQRLQIAGLPAARLVADTRESDRVTLTWIAHRKRILRVTGMTRRSDWEHYGPAFERTAASFRPLTAADRERIVESRLRLRLANAGETVAQVLARGGGTWTAARTAVANGTTLAARLDAGWPVKVPVAQRYGG